MKCQSFTFASYALFILMASPPGLLQASQFSEAYTVVPGKLPKLFRSHNADPSIPASGRGNGRPRMIPKSDLSSFGGQKMRAPLLPRSEATAIRGGGEQGSSYKTLFAAKFYKELLAELIGTFIIVSIGTGSVMSDVFGGALKGLFQVAAAWIIAVTLAIATTGPISGAHLNPAVSISIALLRPSAQFGWAKVIPFAIAQTVGAALASWINLLMYASKIRVFEEANKIVRGSTASVASAKAFGEYYLPQIGHSAALFAEAFGTAFLAFVIFALTNSRNKDIQSKGVYIPPLIGMTVGGLITVIAPLTQAGFNPARDFGPRIVAWLAGWKSIAFQGWWVYIVGPIIGAPLGAALADKILYASDS